MIVTIPRDQAETQVHVTSTFEEEMEPTLILDPRALRNSPTALRLTDVLFALEGEMTLFLWFEGKEDHALLLPLEGRGRLDLSTMGGIFDHRREESTGRILLSTRHNTGGRGRSFFLALEFSRINH